MNCEDGSVRELEGEKINGRHVRDAETKRDYTGTIPGDEEARHVAAYPRVASADRAGWAISLTRSAYTWGLPTIACMHRFTSAAYTSIRAYLRRHCSRPTVC